MQNCKSKIFCTFMLKTQQSVSLDIYPHFENRQNSLLLALISGFSSPNKAAAHDSSSMDSDHGSRWGLNRQIRIIWCVYSFILLLATVLPITVFPQNPQRKIMKWKKRTERGCGGRSDDDRRDEQSLQCVSVCVSSSSSQTIWSELLSTFTSPSAQLLHVNISVWLYF